MNRTTLTSTPPRWLMILAVLLAITAVFPFGWLEGYWPALRYVMNHFFSSEMAHVIGHFMLMGSVGAAVLAVFPRLLRHPVGYLTIMLAFGLSQEALQLWSYKKRPFMGGEFFDIAVDLVGAVAIFALFRMMAARQEGSDGNG